MYACNLVATYFKFERRLFHSVILIYNHLKLKLFSSFEPVTVIFKFNTCIEKLHEIAFILTKLS